ncbi:hypothetical protein Slin15195_G049460 [Septoria linicola]|uniref:Uncharacterized protein n=1 Tax=Septoria linicola TaxID=215465 RepID=A0A9Q9ATB5_9PEZI|nr:hypothetical protein Slin15195_G049460 [Septoria linicola]
MASCTLLERLPRELRDLIYEAALISAEVMVDASKNRGAFVPGLLQTCKQIRAEATKLFYAKNHFRVITPQHAMFTSMNWLKSLSTRNRKQLRTVTVRFVISKFHPGWSYANRQDMEKGELQSLVMTESRYLTDKRKVETFELLEQLVLMKDVRRKSVAFEVDNIVAVTIPGSTIHSWVHDLEDQLHSLKNVFADRGLVQDQSWCEYSMAVASRLMPNTSV